jgi:hypothetical protein
MRSYYAIMSFCPEVKVIVTGVLLTLFLKIGNCYWCAVNFILKNLMTYLDRWQPHKQLQILFGLVPGSYLYLNSEPTSMLV